MLIYKWFNHFFSVILVYIFFLSELTQPSFVASHNVSIGHDKTFKTRNSWIDKNAKSTMYVCRLGPVCLPVLVLSVLALTYFMINILVTQIITNLWGGDTFLHIQLILIMNAKHNAIYCDMVLIPIGSHSNMCNIHVCHCRFGVTHKAYYFPPAVWQWNIIITRLSSTFHVRAWFLIDWRQKWKK